MLPALPAPYDVVLEEILKEMREKPVKAILLAGSAANGRLRPPVSDLDLLIIDDSSPWTIQRETRCGIELHLSMASGAAEIRSSNPTCSGTEAKSAVDRNAPPVAD